MAVRKYRVPGRKVSDERCSPLPGLREPLRWRKDNPSVSFADSSLYTREPLGALGKLGFGRRNASPTVRRERTVGNDLCVIPFASDGFRAVVGAGPYGFFGKNLYFYRTTVLKY